MCIVGTRNRDAVGPIRSRRVDHDVGHIPKCDRFKSHTTRRPRDTGGSQATNKCGPVGDSQHVVRIGECQRGGGQADHVDRFQASKRHYAVSGDCHRSIAVGGRTGQVGSSLSSGTLNDQLVTQWCCRLPLTVEEYALTRPTCTRNGVAIDIVQREDIISVVAVERESFRLRSPQAHIRCVIQ